MTLLVLLPYRVTPGAAAGEFLSSGGLLFCPIVLLLELLPSHVTPGTFAESCNSWSSCWRISKFERRIDVAQSFYSLNSCPVMLLLKFLPSHVTS